MTIHDHVAFHVEHKVCVTSGIVATRIFLLYKTATVTIPIPPRFNVVKVY